MHWGHRTTTPGGERWLTLRCRGQSGPMEVMGGGADRMLTRTLPVWS